MMMEYDTDPAQISGFEYLTFIHSISQIWDKTQAKD